MQSTLLKYLNAGDYASAANQLLRWSKADGRVLPGLTRRRRAEKELFETSEPAPDCEMLQK
ncbi:Phage lysozyme [compost metagenome]